ncbi:hypothetical protein [Candidatus Lokiarchaeum ossiferum]|uniref:hypothetical protein n=1 Tax=Candidatus Lokiarchaeum ossiferum TaxID=2951803 RepID=UPI00352D2093
MLLLSQKEVNFFTQEITDLVEKMGEFQTRIGFFVKLEDAKQMSLSIHEILQLYKSITEIRHLISLTLLRTINAQTPSNLFQIADVKEIEEIVNKTKADENYAQRLIMNAPEYTEYFKKEILFGTITDNLRSIPSFIIRINRWLRNPVCE